MRIAGRSLLVVAAGLIIAAGVMLNSNRPLARAAQRAATQWHPTRAVAVRGAGAPWRVGIQVGHLHAAELPAELSRLHGSTGAWAAGVAEVQINIVVARAAAALLEAEGIDVTLLPATIPPGFDADAFVSVHADGNNDSSARGYKVSPPWRASPASRLLAAALHRQYGQTTGLPEDLNGVTYNMRGYYAFNGYRYRHAIADTTPAAILEMGYVSNPVDRAFLRKNTAVAAQGLAAGVLAYLQQRDPFDRWETLPPVEPIVLRTPRGGAPLHAARDRESTVRLHLRGGELLFASGKVDGWYDVRVRGSYRSFGWVHADDVEGTPAEQEPAATNSGVAATDPRSDPG